MFKIDAMRELIFSKKFGYIYNLDLEEAFYRDPDLANHWGAIIAGTCEYDPEVCRFDLMKDLDSSGWSVSYNADFSPEKMPWRT